MQDILLSDDIIITQKGILAHTIFYKTGAAGSGGGRSGGGSGSAWHGGGGPGNNNGTHVSQRPAGWQSLSNQGHVNHLSNPELAAHNRRLSGYTSKSKNGNPGTVHTGSIERHRTQEAFHRQAAADHKAAGRTKEARASLKQAETHKKAGNKEALLLGRVQKAQGARTNKAETLNQAARDRSTARREQRKADTTAKREQAKSDRKAAREEKARLKAEAKK